MSLFKLKINFTKCHFLIGCLNSNYHFMGIKDKVNRELSLTPMQGNNSLTDKPIKKPTAVFQKTVHREI